MSTLSFTPPLRQSHAEALTISQQAGIYIQKNGPTTSSISIPFLSNPDSIELWSNYENLLYSCLRTGDDKTAHLCLEKLGARFGTNDERVMGLRGLYQEAMAEDNSALMQTLHEYDSILAEDPTVTVISPDLPTILCNHLTQGLSSPLGSAVSPFYEAFREIRTR